MRRPLAFALALVCAAAAPAFGRGEPMDAAAEADEAVAPGPACERLPASEFSDAPSKPHDPTAFTFTFDQLSHFYRKPGEFTYRLNGDEYGFDGLSFIITETHAGAGPGLHVHDTEEAHVLLEGTAEYRIGDQTFTVTGPYVARVPAGVPHTFVNAGSQPFRLVAVFGSKHPGTTRVGPNPLITPRAIACAAALPTPRP